MQLPVGEACPVLYLLSGQTEDFCLGGFQLPCFSSIHLTLKREECWEWCSGFIRNLKRYDADADSQETQGLLLPRLTEASDIMTARYRACRSRAKLAMP